MKKTILFFAFIALTLVACQDKYPDLGDGVYAEFITNKGTFVAQLYYNQTPKTVANFVDLAEGKNALVDEQYKGKRFFDSLIFHRVIKDFMIQGGDPLGNGTGSPGYTFPDEFVDSLAHDKKGILSMANSGPNTNGSQFFITVKETPHLNGRHTVFGEIVLGMEIVDSISQVATAERDKPADDVIIETVNIIRKGNINLSSFETLMEEVEKERKAKELRVTAVKEETAKMFNQLKEEAQELPSGLKMVTTQKGNGTKPNEGESVGVNYEGYLTDGTLFDSNKLEIAEKYENVNQMRLQAGQYAPMPVDFSLDARLIAGFKEGLLKMTYGEEAVLFIPSHLGYGENGAGDIIPPNADLIFKLHIVDPNKQ